MTRDETTRPRDNRPAFAPHDVYVLWYLSHPLPTLDDTRLLYPNADRRAPERLQLGAHAHELEDVRPRLQRPERTVGMRVPDVPWLAIHPQGDFSQSQFRGANGCHLYALKGQRYVGHHNIATVGKRAHQM